MIQKGFQISKAETVMQNVFAAAAAAATGKLRSSLVEGDEQLDRPNSQTTMEVCHARVA